MNPLLELLSIDNYPKNSSNSPQPLNNSTHTPQPFKIFVGGLTGDTTKSTSLSNQDDLFEYFSAFGMVLDCFIIKNNRVNRPGGFGFIVMASEEAMQLVLRTQHKLRGASVDCKQALGKEKAKLNEEEEMKRKIFVGGLPRNLPDFELYKHFGMFGRVQKAYVVKNCATGKTRGNFCLKRFWFCDF